MRRVAWLWAAVLCAATTTGVEAADRSDPRFFGTYCGETTLRGCRTLPGGFKLCKTYRVKDIRARLNYTETIKGGLVHGAGRGTLRDRDFDFVVAGVVVGRGRVRGSATVVGMKPYTTAANLSENGLGLTIEYHGEEHTIRKDQCGNTPPEVNITQFPTGPIRYGQIHFFRGEVSDPEDLPLPSSEFAPDRLAWAFDEEGKLETSPSGLRASTRVAARTSPGSARPEELVGPTTPPVLRYLPPGKHKITFSATDSGGLTARTNIQVTVVNDPPDTPSIFLPRNNEVLRAGCERAFVGQAYDLEDQFLRGSRLVWRSSLDGVIGVGTEFAKPLEQVGTHAIRLTATDSVGESSFKEISVVVEPGGGGCAPLARIVAPPYFEATEGPMAIFSGRKITFVGTVEDAEDAPDELALEWRLVSVGPPEPGQPLGVIGTSSVVEDVEFNATVDRRYEVTFRVTDTDGNTAEDTMTILVLSQPIL